MTAASEPESQLPVDAARRADPAAPRNLVLLVNSRAGRDDDGLAAAIETFAQAGVTAVTLEIDAAGAHLSRLRSLGSDVDAVVVAGGDGTFSRLLPDLVALGKPVGLLPTGTANDLARTLGIATDGGAAALVILAGRISRIDLGKANGIYFCNAAGVGAGVQVTRELNRSNKALLGVLAYARAAWRVLRRAPGFRVRIDGGDGVAFRGRASQVTIANGVHYGGGMTVHEAAAVDDGELDLLVVRPRPLLHYLRHFFAFRRGRYDGNAPVWVGRARRVAVETTRRRECALDGEIRTHTPLEIVIERQALAIFVPPDPQAPT